MDLFFSRDWAEGAGPTVELPSPLFAASPKAAVVFPTVAAGAVVVEEGAGVEVPVVFVKSEDAGAFVDAVAALADVLPPPRLGNVDEPDVVVVVVPAPAVVVEAADAEVLEVGIDPPSLGKLSPLELPLPAVVDPVFAGANMLFGASVVARAGLLSFNDEPI
jgi:hypothetical protein